MEPGTSRSSDTIDDNQGQSIRLDHSGKRKYSSNVISSDTISNHRDYDGNEEVLESATSVSNRKERDNNGFAIRLSKRHLVRQQTTNKLDPLW